MTNATPIKFKEHFGANIVLEQHGDLISMGKDTKEFCVVAGQHRPRSQFSLTRNQAKWLAEILTRYASTGELKTTEPTQIWEEGDKSF